jgi:ubiquinone biosynthesis protein UbiJ
MVMTLTIEVAPEVERALEETAQANGQNVGEYVAELLVHWAKVPPDSEAARRAEIARRLAALDALDAHLATLPDKRKEAGLPPLDDTGISRADFYGYTEREDAQL